MWKTILALFMAALAAGSGSAQSVNWADKLFVKKEGHPLTSHDFGTVPKGAKLLHRFELENIYAVQLDVIELRTSCNICSSVSCDKRSLQSHEKTTIDVHMDAANFNGYKRINVFVKFSGQPTEQHPRGFAASTELVITANSRADIVYNPGEVSFGIVPKGEPATKTIDVEYAGVLAFTVTDLVVPEDAPYKATFKELYRRPGQVGYQVSFALRADAKARSFRDEVFLKTNDPQSPLVPIQVQGTIQAPITLSQEVISGVNLRVGDETSRVLIVRGSRPFRILSVTGQDKDVTITTSLPTNPATAQALAIKVKASKAGAFAHDLQITTDLEKTPATLKIEGSADKN
jgi:hypothetical protein